MGNETKERFEDCLKEGYNLLSKNKLTIGEGTKLLDLCENMLLRYKEVRTSRDNWRKKFEDLKNGK